MKKTKVVDNCIKIDCTIIKFNLPTIFEKPQFKIVVTSHIHIS